MTETDISKIFENSEKAVKTIKAIETLEDSEAENSDFSIDKTMIFISACLTCAELNTRSLKNKNYITDKELQKFSKKINALRSSYKDLFNNLLKTDTGYAW